MLTPLKLSAGLLVFRLFVCVLQGELLFALLGAEPHFARASLWEVLVAEVFFIIGQLLRLVHADLLFFFLVVHVIGQCKCFIPDHREAELAEVSSCDAPKLLPLEYHVDVVDQSSLLCDDRVLDLVILMQEVESFEYFAESDVVDGGLVVVSQHLVYHALIFFDELGGHVLLRLGRGVLEF